jgi:hypothetical protein
LLIVSPDSQAQRAVLGTCIALFAVGLALAFWPGAKDKPKREPRDGKGLDFDKLTPEQCRRVVDS